MIKFPRFFFLAILSDVSPLDGPLHRSFCFQLVPSHQLTVSLQKVQHSTRVEAIKLETMAIFLSFFNDFESFGSLHGPPRGPSTLGSVPSTPYDCIICSLSGGSWVSVHLSHLVTELIIGTPLLKYWFCRFSAIFGSFTSCLQTLGP